MLLASDFDHTFYRGRTIAEEDLAAIAVWQKAGHLFGLCTGRAPLNAFDPADQFGVKLDFLIASNGAAVLNRERWFVFRQFLPDEAIPQICKLQREAGCMGLYANTSDGGIRRCILEDPKNSDISYEELLKEQSLLQCNARFEDLAEAAKAAERLQAKVEGIAVHPNGLTIDCSAAGLNKGTGIAKAAEIFGLSEKECFAIGDNRNDLPMLTRFKSACMADGDPETLKIVGRAVPSVAAYIQSLL